MSRSSYKTQKQYMFLSAFFPTQAFMNAVLVIFYLNYLDITMSQYLYLDSILFISIAVTELPSGIISDYFGRKKILILSKCLILISMFLLLYSDGFSDALISILVLAVGNSLGSGNEEAILYEYFAKHQNINDYKILNSNRNSIFFYYEFYLLHSKWICI